MENKEIYIDGINVAGCVLYCNGTCRDLSHLQQGEYTECNSMCDYGAYARKEKLKRLEQENECLKEKLIIAQNSDNKTMEILKENAELKNRLKTLDDEEFVYEVTEIEYNNFKKMNNYKQALEEIRDIAQIHQYFNPELLEIKGDIGQIQDLKMTEIYNKIDEVLK